MPAAATVLSSLGGFIVRTLCGITAAVGLSAAAQADALDQTFNPAPSQDVWATATQPDEKILVAGGFLRIAGVTRSYFARLNPNGSLDGAFNPAVNRNVFTVVLQPDGKILIGGTFSTVAGQLRACLARLNADGTLDASFDAGMVGNYVRAIVLLPDGRILAGGDFSAVGGRPRTGLVRLHANGATDPTFVGDVSGSLSPTAGRGVFSMARQADDRILLAGQFTMVNNVSRFGVARLNPDGSLDAAFNPSTTASAVVKIVALRDGRIVVGGGFGFMGGQVRNRIARLFADGSLDVSFNADADHVVQAIVEQPDGRLLVGGLFSRIRNTPRSLLARLNPDGSVDAGFTHVASGSASAPAPAVYHIEPLANGRIILAGTFDAVDGQARSGLARLVPSAPAVISSPPNLVAAAGTNVTLSAAVAGALPMEYQWRKDGVPIAGASSSTLTFRPVQPADAGRYDVVATNAHGTVRTAVGVLTVTLPPARLVNVSVRTTLASAQTLIVGLSVGGNPTPVLVRAAGPALERFGLAPVMPDPRLELYRDSTKLLENDSWPDVLWTTFASVGAFPFERGSRDGALLQTLSGPHSAVVSGVGSGVVLVEAYDASTTATGGRLTNISARNRVLPGDGILITGFSVSGSGSIRLLIRAVGPTLALPPFGLGGVLADPKLEVYDARGAKLLENDTWDPSLAASFTAAGAFALAPGTLDAALIVDLPGGASYTAQVSGPPGASGEALVEIYELR